MTYPECWPGTKVPKSPGNAFTCGYAKPIDWKPLVLSAKAGKIHSARVAAELAKGRSLGVIHGLSKTADERIAVHPGSMS